MIAFAVLQLAVDRAAGDHLPAAAARIAGRAHRASRRQRRSAAGVRLERQRRVRHARAGARSCAASPCRCRSSIWSRSAATSASRRPSAPPCCRCCSAWASSAARAGAGCRTGSAACSRRCSARSLQCAAMSGFLFTQDTVGLFTVATAFGHRLQRADPGLCADHPRALSAERGALARADAAAVQRQRHGDRRLARRLSL